MIRRPPRSTRKESSAASDVYKRQEFYLTYLDDIEAAVGEAFANLARDTGLEHPEAINNHAAYTSTWMSALGQYVTDVLRPTYGDYYGFEYSTPTNAQMVAWFLMMYR